MQTVEAFRTDFIAMCAHPTRITDAMAIVLAASCFILALTILTAIGSV